MTSNSNGLPQLSSVLERYSVHQQELESIRRESIQVEGEIEDWQQRIRDHQKQRERNAKECAQHEEARLLFVDQKNQLIQKSDSCMLDDASAAAFVQAAQAFRTQCHSIQGPLYYVLEYLQEGLDIQDPSSDKDEQDLDSLKKRRAALQERLADLQEKHDDRQARKATHVQQLDRIQQDIEQKTQELDQLKKKRRRKRAPQDLQPETPAKASQGPVASAGTESSARSTSAQEYSIPLPGEKPSPSASSSSSSSARRSDYRPSGIAPRKGMIKNGAPSNRVISITPSSSAKKQKPSTEVHVQVSRPVESVTSPIGVVNPYASSHKKPKTGIGHKPTGLSQDVFASTRKTPQLKSPPPQAARHASSSAASLASGGQTPSPVVVHSRRRRFGVGPMP